MGHSGSFLVGSQFDPTLALVTPSPGRLVPGSIPLPSRARFVSAASAASVGEASSGAFRDLVQRRSAPPGLVSSPTAAPTASRPFPENSLRDAPSPIRAEAPSPRGAVPGVVPGVLPDQTSDQTPDKTIVDLLQVPSIEPQASESSGVQEEASDSAQEGAERADYSALVPLQPAPAPPPAPETLPETLSPEKRSTSSDNLAADFRQALAHYRAAALQLG